VGPVRDVFAGPVHPYTQMLISSLPRLDEHDLPKSFVGTTPERPDHLRAGDGPGELQEVGPDHWVLPY
jgi:ABC-type oligopeptide transport system ATPase subunit